MAADRILNMKAKVTSSWSPSGKLGAVVEWSQAGATGLGGGSRVDSSGNIDLFNMPWDTQWTDNVLIRIHLESHMTDQNNRPLPTRFAKPDEGKDPVGCGWFMAQCGGPVTGNPQNVMMRPDNDNQIQINDMRNSRLKGGTNPPDNVPYAWAVRIAVQTASELQFFTLDPETSPKGTGISPIDDDCEADEA